MEAVDEIADRLEVVNIVVVEAQRYRSFPEVFIERREQIVEHQDVGIEVGAQARVETHRIGVAAEEFNETFDHERLERHAIDWGVMAVGLGRHYRSAHGFGEARDDVGLDTRVRDAHGVDDRARG